MKSQTFGIEIEMTGITRAKAAKVALKYFGNSAKLEHKGGTYDEYRVTTEEGKAWKFASDASIRTMRKRNGQLVPADKRYSVEMASPILTYKDIESLQELVRQLRHAGAISESKYHCGIHVHIGAENHTPRTLKNLVNLMAAKEELIYKSLQIDPARVRYCKRINENLIETINKKKPKTLLELADIWYSEYGAENRNRHYHSSRYHGLNLHSTFTKGTIEFRLFNGTMHAGKIRSYIVFSWR